MDFGIDLISFFSDDNEDEKDKTIEHVEKDFPISKRLCKPVLTPLYDWNQTVLSNISEETTKLECETPTENKDTQFPPKTPNPKSPVTPKFKLAMFNSLGRDDNSLGSTAKKLILEKREEMKRIEQERKRILVRKVNKKWKKLSPSNSPQKSTRTKVVLRVNTKSSRKNSSRCLTLPVTPGAKRKAKNRFEKKNFTKKRGLSKSLRMSRHDRNKLINSKDFDVKKLENLVLFQDI